MVLASLKGGSESDMLLIEMQCKDWEHNRVNSGIIELVYRSFPKEEIKLYAEDEHIRKLRESIAKQNIKISSNKIEFENWRTDCNAYSDKYEQLLVSIIEGEPYEEKIMLLSCNKGIVRAVAHISSIYSGRRFYVILHAALEEVLWESDVHTRQGVYVLLSKMKNALLRGSNKYKEEFSLKECIHKCTSHNCYFVLYAPKYREYLNQKIDNEILNKFIFLHHPLYDSSEYCVPANGKLIVGIYGQAVNKNAYDIIDIYNTKYDNGKVLFLVMAKCDNAILALNNVTRMFEQDYVSNEELEQARTWLDCVLIPYDKNQYKVTASGILCDALSEEIPVLMLDSPLLRFYSTYGIGVLRSDTDSLAYAIADLAADKTKWGRISRQCREAEHGLKKLIMQENIKTFGERIK